MCTSHGINHISTRLRKRIVRVAAVVAGLMVASPAEAQRVKVTDLSDLAFGSIANLQADAVRSENLCAFSNVSDRGYSVRATGSGSSGAFTLGSGSRTIAYEVQWSGAAGQTTGTSLLSGVTRTGFISN